MTNIWFEKYRPNRLRQMVLPRETFDAMQGFIDDLEIPHLLFHGPPGSGKTTLANILIDWVAAGCLRLNASSSDRGINVIKTTVKQFATSKPRDSDKINIVFFDEADGLTPDAQNALRNTIETYHSNCRFIFTCNNIYKITAALRSRCQLFQFETLPESKLLHFCKKILRNEEVEYNTKTLKEIVERYYPDIRSIINNLQSSSRFGKLRKNFLDKIVVGDLIRFLNEGKVFAIRQMWINNTDFTRIYKWLFNQYSGSIEDEGIRSDVMVAIAEYMYKDNFVADKEINATACILEIMSIQELELDFRSTK